MFVSRTSMTEQMRENSKEVIRQLKNHAFGYPFREPVNYIALGLLDYPEKIRHPMDLDTVYKKLKKRQYSLVEECLSDIFLIWQNCKTYNSETHWLHQNATKLSEFTKKLVRNYLFAVKFNKQTACIQEIIQPESLQLADSKEDTTIEGQGQWEYSSFLKRRQSFLQLLEKCGDKQTVILFMLIKRHCPHAMLYDQYGNANINMYEVDQATLDLAMLQINRWRINVFIER